MRRFCLVLIFLFTFFLAPQVKAEQINSFVADYWIQKDGSIKVREEIVYQFDVPRHGIYRNIPYLKTNSDNQTFRLDFSNFQVNHSFNQSQENNQIKLKIGDPNRTLIGEQTYIIEYEVKGALTYFTDHDEFYWNVNGNGWEVSSLSVQARVHLPDKVDSNSLNTKCFTGRTGSTQQLCEVIVEEEMTTFLTTQSLASQEGLTLVFGFPKNLVQVLEPKPYTQFWQTPFGQFLMAVLLILFTLFLLFWYLLYPVWIIIKWFRSGRDPKATVGEASAWFSVPKINKKELTPGEAGTLIDEKVDTREFFATIVDLARQGFLKIEERKKNDFYLIKQPHPAGSRSQAAYEQELITDVFGTKAEVKIKDFKVYTAFAKLTKNLYQEVVTLQLFPKNPQSVRIFYGVIIALALASANLLLLLVAIFFGMQMPQKTTLGVDTANMVKALKNFLTSQERQLSFQADKQLLFEKFLPFAIAFGVEKIWAKRFAKFDLRSPDWYESQTGQKFNSVVLANSLSRSVNNWQSGMSSTRSSSGFSSGFSGGSSGGGGGGGGGGSW